MRNNFNSMPRVDDVIAGWETEIKTNQRRQILVDGDVEYKNVYVKMRGTIQPLKSEDIILKPEEQRSWAWYQIHVTTRYESLKTNQIIYIDNKPYKVMARKDYTRNGYNEYHIIADFQNNGRGQ